MHCIITSNEKLIKCAKRLGEEVVEVEKWVIIGNKDKKKYYKVTNEVVDNFLKAFPDIVMETTGTRALKYILKHNLGCKKNLYDKIYPKLARKFKTTQEQVASAIMGVYSKCITNMPVKYKRFFDSYECSVHWEFKYSYDFVKACQEYIYENYERLCRNSASPEEIEKFLDTFKCISEKTLGYKCIKYILENQIECNLETREAVYRQLARKFETVPGGVANGITNVFTSIMRHYSYSPKEFINFYKKYTDDKLKSIGERSVEFVQIMQRYLEEN